MEDIAFDCGFIDLPHKNSHSVIDARGLLCPMPVLKLRKALLVCENDAIITLICTDMAAQIDVPHFCNENNYALLYQEKLENLLCFQVKRVRTYA